MAWYWVNQGQHQAEEIALGVISSPVPTTRVIRHWELDRIPVDSTVFGCARRVVSHVGTTTGLTQRHPTKPYPDLRGGDAWVVEVRWNALGDPLLVDDIPRSVRAGHPPFDKHGDGLQQYCIELPLSSPVRTWLVDWIPRFFSSDP
jgi:hypothetical protein